MTNPFSTFANQAPAQESPAAPAQESPAAPAQTFNQEGQAQAATAFNNAQGQETPRPAGNLADMFNNGAAVSGDKFTEDLGAAVAIKAKTFVSQMATQHGPTDAMEAEWVVLDGPNQGAHRSGLIFATVVVKALQSGLQSGRPLTVGVIAKGEAKAGKNAPYLLNEASQDQVNLAIQAAQAYGWA